MTIFMLMVTFAKFGLLCFGGGYMIIPMLLHTFVEEKAILTLSSYGNLISLSQITPGPVSINAATYVGYLSNGVLGGIFASIGLILPGLFLAYFMVRFLQKFKGTFFVNGFNLDIEFVGGTELTFKLDDKATGEDEKKIEEIAEIVEDFCFGQNLFGIRINRKNRNQIISSR